MLSYNAMDHWMSRTKYFLKKTAPQEGENFQKKGERECIYRIKCVRLDQIFPSFSRNVFCLASNLQFSKSKMHGSFTIYVDQFSKVVDPSLHLAN